MEWKNCVIIYKLEDYLYFCIFTIKKESVNHLCDQRIYNVRYHSSRRECSSGVSLDTPLPQVSDRSSSVLSLDSPHLILSDRRRCAPWTYTGPCFVLYIHMCVICNQTYSCSVLPTCRNT